MLGLWLAGGAYALLGALTLAELGAALPRSGGQYVFARRAFGPYAGFVVGWSDWIGTAGSLAAVGLTVGEFSGQLVPALAGRAAPIGAGLVLAYAALQYRGVRTADRTQQSLSLAKALVLAALVAWCLAAPAAAPAPPSPMPAGFALATALVLALQSIVYTYDGWNGMLYFSGEVEDPGRRIPRAMAGGVVAVIAVYVGLNAAFLHVLPVERMAGDPMVAGTAAGVVFGPAGDRILRLVMLVSLLGAGNAMLMMASRIPQPMAEDGLVPRAFASVSAGGTPVPALFASVTLALLLLATRTFDTVLALLAFFFVLNYVVSFSALLALRRREPGLPRPWRAPGGAVTAWLLLLVSLAFLAGNLVTDTANALFSLGLLVASGPAFLLVRRAQRAP